MRPVVTSGIINLKNKSGDEYANFLDQIFDHCSCGLGAVRGMYSVANSLFQWPISIWQLGIVVLCVGQPPISPAILHLNHHFGQRQPERGV